MQNSIIPHGISLTAIFVHDQNSNGYTAYFAQFPEVIAEGDDEMQAEKNLFRVLKEVFEYQKTQEIESMHGVGEVTTKSFNLEVA